MSIFSFAFEWFEHALGDRFRRDVRPVAVVIAFTATFSTVRRGDKNVRTRSCLVCRRRTDGTASWPVAAEKVRLGLAIPFVGTAAHGTDETDPRNSTGPSDRSFRRAGEVKKNRRGTEMDDVHALADSTLRDASVRVHTDGAARCSGPV